MAATAATDPAQQPTGDAEAEAAVRSVLQAKTHYNVLDAPQDATQPELRRRYLRASVRVHPDKNTHPDATRAFQRVAQAWSVLGDEEKRAGYDTELRTGRAPADQHSPSAGDAAGPSMSVEEAFAAFGFATAACAAGAAGGLGGVGDFAETLFWAQRLSQMRDAHGVPNAAALATGGFALSAGLRTLGAAADAAGLKGAADAAERTAAVVSCVGQVAAVGAAVAQVPAVREAITSGASKASERAQQLGEAVGDAKEAALARASQIRHGETAAKVGQVFTGVASWVQRARDSLAHGAEGTTDTDQPPQTGGAESAAPGGPEHELVEGARVRIFGLNGAPHFNGRVGEVVGFDCTTERYRVRLLPCDDGTTAGYTATDSAGDGGEVKRVKRVNLQLLPAAQSAESSATC